MIDSQCTDTVVMVRPAAFTTNPQTAASNAFQAQNGPADASAAQRRAESAFLQAAQTLATAGIQVLVLDDLSLPPTPDAIFPNNWFTTHPDGRVVLYPMTATNRRWERRPRALLSLLRKAGFVVTGVVDLSSFERSQEYLEGTGAMVLDRVNRRAYVARSPRASAEPLNAFCQAFAMQAVSFDAGDAEGRAIYHTNVMMSVGERFAAVGLAAIRDAAARAALSDALQRSGKALINLTLDEIEHFAGNLLQLSRQDGSRVIALSEQALDALSRANRLALGEHGELVAMPIESIETLAGGSIRCMLAEVFLPSRHVT